MRCGCIAPNLWWFSGPSDYRGVGGSHTAVCHCLVLMLLFNDYLPTYPAVFGAGVPNEPWKCNTPVATPHYKFLGEQHSGNASLSLWHGEKLYGAVLNDQNTGTPDMVFIATVNGDHLVQISRPHVCLWPVLNRSCMSVRTYWTSLNGVIPVLSSVVVSPTILHDARVLTCTSANMCLCT